MVFTISGSVASRLSPTAMLPMVLTFDEPIGANSAERAARARQATRLRRPVDGGAAPPLPPPRMSVTLRALASPWLLDGQIQGERVARL